jgi:hypothetical protein
MDDIRWGRAILNGLFVWLLSLIIFMLPAVLYATVLGAQLGPEMQDPAAVSQEISQRINAMYAGSWLLIVGLIVATAVLVFWRAQAVANGTWHRRWLNGLIVGVVPAVLSLLFVLCGGFDVWDVVTLVVYVVAGVLGGLSARPT